MPPASPQAYQRLRRPYVLLTGLAALLLLSACDPESPAGPGPIPDPEPDLFQIPVVVHVLHQGEPLGMGTNLATARIVEQIALLNADYRRQPGTRGFNDHPDGADTRITFVLARTAPDGTATTGIVRVDASSIDNPTPPNRVFDYYAHYSYWPPDQYLNIWTLPLPASATDVFLGKATGPHTDLPGAHLFEPGEPEQAEGILVNAAHFGASDLASEYNLGRTLTHEVGHYLGLLHTWGDGTCATNDYCADTPAVANPVTGCPATPPLGCEGQPVQLGNYMNYTFDRCMNLFTKEQAARMHYVLRHSPRRTTLLTAPGLVGPTQ